MSEPLLQSGGQNYGTDPQLGQEREHKHRRWISATFILAALVGAAVSFAATFAAFKVREKGHPWHSTTAPRNVVMMISDGFGPASETYSRQYYQYINKLTPAHQLPLDTILVGQSRTQSSDSFVTDSAAGATAFSCGLKTYNGAIGVDPEKVPCATVLESAKQKQGMTTGLVVTSRITHATPASFSAHVVHRDMEDLIAEHQIGENPLGRSVDLMFGGGSCHFLPADTNGSCRADNRDLFADARESYGWTVLRTRSEFDAIDTASPGLPLMSLFTPDHMNYDIDRDPSKEPSLSEMAKAALDILKRATSDTDKGFFLMIEGSRIDMAAHTNDPGAHVHEILQYHKTIQVVKDFVDANPDTVLISTSDHETGGFTLARQVSPDYPEYLWHPEAIARVRNSTSALSKKWASFSASSKREQEQVIREEIVRDGCGIDDSADEDIAFLMNATNRFDVENYLAYMISVRAQLGWTTHGHSAVDVNLYAYGANFHQLVGNHENTDIGDFIVRNLDLDLVDLTKKLKHTKTVQESVRALDLHRDSDRYHPHL